MRPAIWSVHDKSILLLGSVAPTSRSPDVTALYTQKMKSLLVLGRTGKIDCCWASSAVGLSENRRQELQPKDAGNKCGKCLVEIKLML